MLDTPILGFEVKPDCTGMSVDMHLGIPGVADAHVSGHGGTDGVDVGAKGNKENVLLERLKYKKHIKKKKKSDKE